MVKVKFFNRDDRRVGLKARAMTQERDQTQARARMHQEGGEEVRKESSKRVRSKG